MKQVITFIIALLCAICALAQTEAQDSIKAKELGEVVVEAQMQRINAEVSTYIPMARQKNAAQNAVSLLSMMSIPQISVDPVSQAVQTAHGQNVSIFIDYLPATAFDFIVAHLKGYTLHFSGATVVFRDDVDILPSQQSCKSVPVAGIAQSLGSGNFNFGFRPLKTVKFLRIGSFLLWQGEAVTLRQCLADAFVPVSVAPRFHAFAVVADHVEHDMTVRLVGFVMTDYEKLCLVKTHHLDVVKSDFKHLFIAQLGLVVGSKRQCYVSGGVADSPVLHCLSLEARHYLIALFAHHTTAAEYLPSVGSKDFLVVFFAGYIIDF